MVEDPEQSKVTHPARDGKREQKKQTEQSRRQSLARKPGNSQVKIITRLQCPQPRNVAATPPTTHPTTYSNAHLNTCLNMRRGNINSHWCSVVTVVRTAHPHQFAAATEIDGEMARWQDGETRTGLGCTRGCAMAMVVRRERVCDEKNSSTKVEAVACTLTCRVEVITTLLYPVASPPQTTVHSF